MGIQQSLMAFDTDGWEPRFVTPGVGALTLTGAKPTLNGIINPLDGGTIAAATIAYIQIEADGTITTQGGAYQWWYFPTTGAIGNGYYIRFTKQSGDTPDYTVADWSRLSFARKWGYSRAGSGVVLVEISANSGGSPVAASGTYTVTAT